MLENIGVLRWQLTNWVGLHADMHMALSTLCPVFVACARDEHTSVMRAHVSNLGQHHANPCMLLTCKPSLVLADGGYDAGEAVQLGVWFGQHKQPFGVGMHKIAC